MHVRPANRGDLPAIHEIYNDAVLRTTASYDYEPRPFDYRIRWFEEHARERLPVVVAVGDAKEVVGWSSLSRYHSRKGYQFTVENSIYVSAAHRGLGVGKLLIPPLIDAAGALGLRAIIAAIDGDNQPSIRLHARFGFAHVGHFKQVGFKFGRWLDVVYMERLVEQSPASQE